MQTTTNTVHGILFIALFTCASFFLADFQLFQYLSLSPLIIGIVLGMIYGNTLKKDMPETWLPGIAFSSKKILRAAIVLYGFRLTFQNVANVGSSAIITDLIIITGTLLLGLMLGKLLHIDSETSLLCSMGSAICGAAAVLGTESVLNNKPHKTAIAVSTVVIFGTTAMFLYPFIYRNINLSLNVQQWGIYTGSTIHEVAHVVGAGNEMNESVASTAIIVKMIRVIFLAPILLLIAIFVGNKTSNTSQTKKAKITIPWFAFGFIAMIGFNSLHLLPLSFTEKINEADTFLLTMAMTALGMETHLRKVKEAGLRPFILTLTLFGWLVFGGYWVIKAVTTLIH